MGYPKRLRAVSPPVKITSGGMFFAKIGGRVEQLTQLKLPSDRNLVVPDGGFATIRHEVQIDTCGRLVWLCREPGMLGDQQLLVDQGPVVDGEVVTVVLNIGNEAYRIKRGDVVSYLISLS